jgi:hypothetical protein
MQLCEPTERVDGAPGRLTVRVGHLNVERSRRADEVSPALRRTRVIFGAAVIQWQSGTACEASGIARVAVGLQAVSLNELADRHQAMDRSARGRRRGCR